MTHRTRGPDHHGRGPSCVPGAPSTTAPGATPGWFRGGPPLTKSLTSLYPTGARPAAHWFTQGQASGAPLTRGPPPPCGGGPPPCSGWSAGPSASDVHRWPPTTLDDVPTTSVTRARTDPTTVVVRSARTVRRAQPSAPSSPRSPARRVLLNKEAVAYYESVTDFVVAEIDGPHRRLRRPARAVGGPRRGAHPGRRRGRARPWCGLGGARAPGRAGAAARPEPAVLPHLRDGVLRPPRVRADRGPGRRPRGLRRAAAQLRRGCRRVPRPRAGQAEHPRATPGCCASSDRPVDPPPSGAGPPRRAAQPRWVVSLDRPATVVARGDRSQGAEGCLPLDRVGLALPGPAGSDPADEQQAADEQEDRDEREGRPTSSALSARLVAAVAAAVAAA